MGYYTYYYINVLHEDKETRRVILDEIVNKSDADDFDDSEYRYCTVFSKWYCWDDDLVEISKKYPDVIIDVTAECEDFDDHWKTRIRNGEIEGLDQIVLPYCSILFNNQDKFDSCQKLIFLYNLIAKKTDKLYNKLKSEFNLKNTSSLTTKLKELNKVI